MNGFLAALVARAEGRLPVLERRAHSLFEPVAGVATSRVASGESVRHDDGAVSVAAAGPREAASVRSVSAERNALPVVAAPSARLVPAPRAMSEHTVLRDEAHFEHGNLQAPDPRQIAGRPAPTGVAVAPRTVLREAANRPPDASAAARIAQPPPRPGDALAPARPRAEAARGEGVARVPAPRVPSAVLPPTPGALQRRGSAPSRPTVLLAKARIDSAARREAPSAAAPAPVQISIGRVEIRAVATIAERPRAVGPAAPRLSLDDYLRGRNNGAAR